MTTSIFYQTPWLYEGLMRALYLGGYKARSEALAALIPERSSVVDLCCGPATLYFKHLRFKQVSYTGLDINRAFVERLSFSGSEKVRNPQPDGTTITGMVWDATADAPLPKGDYVIMQASLYHFLPDPYPIVDRMLAAAEKYVILTEPVRNLADSKNPLLAGLARKLTNPGTGDQPNRFNERRFEEFLARYRDKGRVVESYPIAAGREQLCVLRAKL
jgi:SAM-dependent methyltransferase